MVEILKLYLLEFKSLEHFALHSEVMGTVEHCSRTLTHLVKRFTKFTYLINDWYAVVEVIAGGAEQRSAAIVLEEQVKWGLSQIISRTDIGPLLQ